MSDVLKSSFAEKRRALVEQARATDASLAETRKTQSQRIERSKQTEASRTEFLKAHVTLQRETSAVCHELYLARSGDAWGLAFADVANYCVGQLAYARLAGSAPLEAAMVINLQRLAEAVSKSFPDRKMVLEPWKRAVVALGAPQEPAPTAKPHPQVDSWSRIVCTLRDTGPKTPFRELFVGSEAGVHLVRPA